jgi:hypothetical protein
VAGGIILILCSSTQISNKRLICSTASPAGTGVPCPRRNIVEQSGLEFLLAFDTYLL